LSPGRSSHEFPSGLLAISFAAGERMIRIHHQDRGPVFFGPAPGKPPGNRFDAPNGEFRILYTAQRLEGAFVETILRRPVDRILRKAFVYERCYSEIALRRTVTLAKMFDEGLQVHRIDAGAISIDNYGPSRKLALAVHEQFPQIDGVAYRSRYNNGEICYALFDRVGEADLDVVSTTRLEQIPVEVERMMRLHGAVFDESLPV
jgi:hypothetical protein